MLLGDVSEKFMHGMKVLMAKNCVDNLGRLLDGRTWDEMPENDLVPEPALRVLA